MEFRQIIHIEGNCIEDIFKLPCIQTISKESGTYYYYLDNGLYAEIGDWLCEDYQGEWHVFTEKEL